MSDPFGTSTKIILICLAFTRDPDPNSLVICPESGSGLDLYWMKMYWIHVNSWNRSQYVPDRPEVDLPYFAFHSCTCADLQKTCNTASCKHGTGSGSFLDWYYVNRMDLVQDQTGSKWIRHCVNGASDW